MALYSVGVAPRCRGRAEGRGCFGTKKRGFIYFVTNKGRGPPMALLPFRSRMPGGHLRVLPTATAGFGRGFGSHISSAAIKGSSRGSSVSASPFQGGRHTVTHQPAPPDARVALPRWHRPLSMAAATGAGGATAPTEGSGAGVTVVSDPVAFDTGRPYGTAERQLRHDRSCLSVSPSSALRHHVRGAGGG